MDISQTYTMEEKIDGVFLNGHIYLQFLSFPHYFQIYLLRLRITI